MLLAIGVQIIWNGLISRRLVTGVPELQKRIWWHGRFREVRYP
jgi:hypothetical protein